jgi:prophage DNA circulation protein
MAIPLWRLNLQPASYNGIPFYVNVDSKSSGQRNVVHEFPKKNTPYTELMGRRARKFTISAYVLYSPELNPDYQGNRDALDAALEADEDTGAPGVLVHPLMGEDIVVVDTYNVIERVERGGMAEFEISFVEAGVAPSSSIGADTQSASNAAAQSAITSFQGSSDITQLGPGGIGHA